MSGPLTRLPRTGLDRVMVRVAVSVGVIVAAASASSVTPTWRAVLGWVAVLLVVALLLLDIRRRQTTPYSVVLVLATSVVVASFGAVSTVWVAFIGVATGAQVALALPIAATLAAVPAATLAVTQWSIGASVLTLAINVGATVLTFACTIAIRRQRDTQELAATQQEVIRAERARAEAADRQREVAAQLHDVLAHTLSGLIITLQGASLTAKREQVSDDLADRLHTATSLAKDGLTEARSAVESLHGQAEAIAEPLPVWLDRTLHRLRSGGALDVTVDGTPDDIPVGWHNLARSVLMEGLTNSIRHAQGAPVRITVSDKQIRVLSVGDASRFDDRGHHSGGHGLAGMDERVTAAGGRLTHGPTSDGYDLTMSIPVTHAAVTGAR